MNLAFVGRPEDGLGSILEVQSYYKIHQDAVGREPRTLQNALKTRAMCDKQLIVRYFGVLTVLDDLLSNESHDPVFAWRLYKRHALFVQNNPYHKLVSGQS